MEFGVILGLGRGHATWANSGGLLDLAWYREYMGMQSGLAQPIEHPSTYTRARNLEAYLKLGKL